MIDLFREILQALRNNRTRTFLTGLAVAWGIFMLIVLLGISRGVTNSFGSRMSLDNSRSVNVYGGWTSKAFKGYRDGRRIELEDADINKVAHSDNRHIDGVTAAKSLDSTKVSTDRDYISESVYGHYPSEASRARLNIVQGRFINQLDIDQKRRVIVLNQQNATTLFGAQGEKSAVGKRVNLMGLSWLVVGVYSHDWERGSYIPYTTAMLLTGNDRTVSQLTVSLDNVETIEDGENAEKVVRDVMAKAHDFDPDDGSAIHIWNRFTSYLTQMTAMNILTVAVWIIGIFTLLSGIVGVSNIMFVSVRERTHEIGIRRAIGARPRSVLLQIVAESVVITTVFGYVGIFLGMLVTGVIDALSKGVAFLDNPTVDISIAIKVTVVLIVAGAIAGLFPAIKATKVKPVEALRDE